MNNRKTVNQGLLRYQAQKLQDLINEMLGCCDNRKLYESQRFNLPHAELRCLLLFKGERYLTVKGIAQRLDVARSRVTALVTGLFRKGLVEQIDDPKDARIKLISLTSEGKRKSEEIAAFQGDLHSRILLSMGDDERKSTISHLELLRSAMEAVKEQLV